MAFFWRKKIRKIFRKRTKNTLQITLKIYPSGKFSSFVYQILSSKKRASSPVFSGRKGSLAVEASLVLPLFLFFLLNLISILQLLSCYGRIEAALHQTARKWALYAYAAEENEGILGLMSAVSLPGELEQLVGKDYLEHSPVVNGRKGLQCFLSRVPDEEENIDLIVTYRVTPVFALPGFSEFKMMNRCRIRAWTGYDTAKGEKGNGAGEKIVYMTEHGTVYHESRECTHLKLSVSRVEADSLPGLRNESGGKYYPCEKCQAQEGSSFYYIAQEGEKYHSSLGCSGLKRQIMAVPLSQTNGMGACSRCCGQ